MNTQNQLHCSHRSHDVEATQNPRTNEQINKRKYTMEYFSTIKKEGNPITCYNMDEP